MTTSSQPWTLELMADGFTYVKDSSGERIAKFTNYRNAEYVLGEFDVSMARIRELENDIDALQSRLDSKDEQIASLKEELTKAQSKL